ncbi:archaetidylserine decarboxylase [Ferrimonas lipolytica]|uniref:Phosphatidylserine decarboxylase proenzyme n=1 Tax=Ferrimonas lipolytica TaxID=2724191 RepID=A0A6H1UMD4_9GAMM|nr:archaetidylserine decarboxylase [Ferrimonas lipolytica]QIZ78962.1 phosphatidylserine decarboxylase [Ferrimonas lipolytica]
MPQHGLSRLVGRFAAAKCGKVTTAAIDWFIKQYNINMDEALIEDTTQFETFNDFFTRELKPGLRPLIGDDTVLVQPVDGRVSQVGPIDGNRIIQAKGHDYTLEALLGGNAKDADPFRNGSFTTIYLSPQDYHRIHMPFAGTLRKMIYVPGDLFSVNPLTAENVPNLFARNERVVTIFDTEYGPMAMVLVGATIVASIETVWAGTITPPTGKIMSWDYPEDGLGAIKLEKGAEMGRFKLGSTIVACFGEGMINEFVAGFTPGAKTRLGQMMAQPKL